MLIAIESSSREKSQNILIARRNRENMTKGGKCPTCGLVVKTNLRRHMKNHLSYEDRPHKVSLTRILI